MKLNVGRIDSIVRTLLAFTIGYLYYAKIIQGFVGVVLLVLAVILFMTSFVGFCPIYAVFHLSTKGQENSDK